MTILTYENAEVLYFYNMSDLEIEVYSGRSPGDHVRSTWWQIERLAGASLEGYVTGEELPFGASDPQGQQHGWRITRMLITDSVGANSYPAIRMDDSGNAYYLADDDVVRRYSAKDHTVRELDAENLELMGRAGELSLDALRSHFGQQLAA